VVPFKVHPCHHYTRVPTFFPIFIKFPEGFEWNVPSRHGVLDVSYGLKMRPVRGQFCSREKKKQIVAGPHIGRLWQHRDVFFSGQKPRHTEGTMASSIVTMKNSRFGNLWTDSIDSFSQPIEYF